MSRLLREVAGFGSRVSPNRRYAQQARHRASAVRG